VTRGRFITLEGIEGAGKSSLQRLLVEALVSRGRVVCATREPGGTPLAEEIRALALGRRADGMPATTELLLMFAARAAHVVQRIEPALARGEWVVCDRFTDATRAYQGAGRGVAAAAIEALAGIAHPGLVPDLTLLLDLPPEVGLQRVRKRAEAGDRFEDEAVEFFTRVRAGYLAQARLEPRRFRVIDATQGADAVLAEALRWMEAP
jgi:dTMP kinase